MRGGSEDSKFSQFQIFPKLGTGGGGIEFQIFPKFKKVQIILGEGGGQENCGLFPLFGTFFNWKASLSRVKYSCSLPSSPELVRYLTLESPCEFGLEFQGSGVVTALTWRMKNSEPISPHKCKVLYQFIQNRTPVTFLFKMHGVSSSLSIRKDTKIAYLCPSLLIIKQLLNF